MDNMFSKNLTYLLDNKYISVQTILNLTNHNSPGLISMWKTGERQIITSDLIKIADYLNLTVDDLLNKDLSSKETELDEFEILFDKYKEILTESDKEHIKFIIEQRKKEIDKEMENEE